jgi:hypothetical protein
MAVAIKETSKRDLKNILTVGRKSKTVNSKWIEEAEGTSPKESEGMKVSPTYRLELRYIPRRNLAFPCQLQ